MDFSSPWLWIPVLVSGIGLVIGIRIYSWITRKKQISELLLSSKFRKAKGKPFTRDEKRVLPLLQRGNSGRFEDVLTSDSGALLFDYRYRFGMPGVASVIYTQTVAALRVPADSIPDFQLGPKSLLDRVGTKLGMKEITLSSIPDFCERRWLRGAEVFAIDAKFQKVAPALQQLDAEGQWSIEKGGSWMLVYRHAKTVSPSSWPDLLKQSQAMSALFLQ